MSYGGGFYGGYSGYYSYFGNYITGEYSILGGGYVGLYNGVGVALSTSGYVDVAYSSGTCYTFNVSSIDWGAVGNQTLGGLITGGIGGAVGGAAVGSIEPGPGTLVGGAVGALGGAISGAVAGGLMELWNQLTGHT